MSVVGEGCVITINVSTIVSLVVGVHGAPMGYLKRYVRIAMEGDFVRMTNVRGIVRFVMARHIVSMTHDKQKQYYKVCGGSALCEHDKDKRFCKVCGGSALCKTPLCETQATNRRYKGHC